MVIFPEIKYFLEFKHSIVHKLQCCIIKTLMKVVMSKSYWRAFHRVSKNKCVESVLETINNVCRQKP